MKPSVRLLVASLGCALPVACAVAAPVLSGTVDYHAGAPSPLAQKLRLGHDAVGKREFAKADALYTEAARLDPKSPLPALALAESARIRNDEARARGWLTKAAEIAPEDPLVLTAWARWHYAHGDHAKAEALWTQTLAAQPRATSALVDLGDLYFNVHRRPDKAGEYYRKALAIEPKLAGAHHALGMVQLAANNAPGAIASFEEAARLSPENPLPLQGLGRAHAMKKDLDSALAALDRALAAQPSYYPARLDKGDLLFALGKSDAALAEYQAVAKAHPKVAATHVKLGMLYQQRQMPAEAMTAYRTAVDLEPTTAVAYNNMAWLAAEGSGQLDRALQWAGKAVELGPDEPMYQGTLGWVHQKRGDAAKAVAVLEKATAGAGRTLPDTHYLLGRVYAEQGRKDDALNAFRRALSIDPVFSNAQDTLLRIKRLETG